MLEVAAIMFGHVGELECNGPKGLYCQAVFAVCLHMFCSDGYANPYATLYGYSSGAYHCEFPIWQPYGNTIKASCA